MIFSDFLRHFRSVAIKSGAILLIPLILAACSSDGEKENYQERPVEKIYNGALTLLENKRYNGAGKEFEEVERQHPYSSWATKAQIMAIYAWYEADKYDNAVLAADRFIDLHPNHKDIAYAWYMKGMSYYEQISDIGRDQKMTHEAMQSFRNLIERFPQSDYARDAKLKVDLTEDHLAGKQMEIGRFYQTQKQYGAAINRFRRVIEQYQTTSHTPEALLRLTESYLALGVIFEAQSAAAVLGHNFPGSDWYTDAYYLLSGRDLRPTRNTDSWLDEWMDRLNPLKSEEPESPAPLRDSESLTNPDA